MWINVATAYTYVDDDDDGMLQSKRKLHMSARFALFIITNNKRISITYKIYLSVYPLYKVNGA